MYAVAWTDCIQGLLLFVGLLGLLIAASPGLETLCSATTWIISHQPHKAAVPSWELCRTWLSTILLVGFSGAVYPQAIQRIYAARDGRVLKRSLSLMVFMPLVTILVVFLIGILGIVHFSNLQGISADQIMPLLLREWAEQSLWRHALALMVITGILAALVGMIAGSLVSVCLTLIGFAKVWGFHAGLVGLGLNILLCVTCSLRWSE